MATVLAMLACWGLLSGLTAFPAAAHDQLKRSSPERNAEISGLDRVELEYTARVRFPAMVLRGPAGAVAIGKPRLDGAKVLVDVTGPLSPGRYVIGWRVVSSDGHPIEGEIPFTVTVSSTPPSPGSPPATSSPTASPPATVTATTTTTDAPSATDAPAAGSDPAAGSSGIPGWLWATAFLVAIAAAGWVGSRRGRRRQDPAGPHRGAGPPAS
ncbi:copper resistance CopC family protein [Sphaerisporangium rufum]|nr:copper resistance CopC family protein [Sphaerisporangium rufum]